MPGTRRFTELIRDPHQRRWRTRATKGTAAPSTPASRLAQWSRDHARARLHRVRRRPAKLHSDRRHGYDRLSRWLRERGIGHGIARKGVEPSRRLGRYRWVVERTVSWLVGCRGLHHRHERKAEHFLAFVGTAAAPIGYRRLASLLTD